MWRFEEGQLSFDEAMQETSTIHERKLQYERKPPPRPAAGNEGVRENMRIAQEKLREAQRENLRLTDALQQPEGRHLGDLMTRGLQPDSRPVTPRAVTPRSREVQLEQDNARLRQQVDELRSRLTQQRRASDLELRAMARGKDAQLEFLVCKLELLAETQLTSAQSEILHAGPEELRRLRAGGES